MFFTFNVLAEWQGKVKKAQAIRFLVTMGFMPVRLVADACSAYISSTREVSPLFRNLKGVGHGVFFLPTNNPTRRFIGGEPFICRKGSQQGMYSTTNRNPA